VSVIPNKPKHSPSTEMTEN